MDLFHLLASSRAHFASQGVISHDAFDLADPILRSVGHEQVSIWFGQDALGRPVRADHGAGAGHGFKHFRLNAAGDPKRRDHGHGLLNI